jgi:dolichyl-phosphate-mannose--protein O-mannosyl transferase
MRVLSAAGKEFETKEVRVIGLLITILVAALAYLLLVAITGSAIVGIVAAILILISGIPTGGFGFGSRWGGRGTTAP